MVWPADGAFLCGYVVTRVRPLMWRHATIIASLFSQNFRCCSVFNRYLEQFSAVPATQMGHIRSKHRKKGILSAYILLNYLHNFLSNVGVNM